MAQQSSINAYIALEMSGKKNTQHGKVLMVLCDELLRSGLGLTRRQIVRATGLEINVVCGRVKELLDKEQLYIADDLVTCRFSGLKVEMVMATEEDEDDGDE